MQEIKNSVSAIARAMFPDDGQLNILEAAGLNGICTDPNLVVVRSFGDTTPFLKTENFNANLCELLPDEISVQLKAAAYRAIKSQKRVTLSKISFANKILPVNHFVNIVISPYLSAERDEQRLLILFEATNYKPKNRQQTTLAELKQLSMQHLISLEQELAEAKDNLEDAYKIIDASNENLQSFNEELQSANEEMQSANEELQSVNEELQTINKEQHDNNAELTKSNDDLNTYFRSNTNGQLFVDHNMLLKKYTPGAVKLINLRESDIGRSLTHITTNIKFETLTEDIRQVILDGKTITREAESPNGKIYQVMTMPYVQKNNDLPDGAIISFYEITELKRLMISLDISNKKLSDSIIATELSKEKVIESLEKEKHLNTMKSRFVSMASHEFKTPLTSIQLSAELIGRLAMDLDHPTITKYTETIKNASKNLSNILNDYLSLELLETGKFIPILSEFDVVKFARDVAEDMRSLVKKEQQILFRHSGQGSIVMLNPQLIRNCIINLISNAIKYSGPKSFIEFCTEITDTYLTIIVRDNGIGIPEEDQKHLFEAFFRANNTGNVPGTGLGLNIVNRYIKLMNGNIRFDSRVNEGTTFTITLPVRPEFSL